MEFEFVYIEATVQHFSHYTTEIYTVKIQVDCSSDTWGNPDGEMAMKHEQFS